MTDTDTRLPFGSTPFTRDEKGKAIMRELAFRRDVFARRVLRKQMTPHEAKYQIAIFEAILEDYKP